MVCLLIHLRSFEITRKIMTECQANHVLFQKKKSWILTTFY